MKSKLGVRNVSKRKFNEISEAFMEVFSEEKYIRHIIQLENAQEFVDFLQFLHPGSYSIDDVSNFIEILCLRVYRNSKKYVSNEIFKYTMWDIYKHYGTNYFELLDQLEHLGEKNSKILKDLNLSVAGGVGGFSKEHFHKLLASGLAVAMPLTSFGNLNVSASEARFRSTGEQKIAAAPEKKGWWGKTWEWLNKHPYVKMFMFATIFVGICWGGYSIYDSFKNSNHLKKFRKDSKIKDLEEKYCDHSDGQKKDSLVVYSLKEQLEKIAGNQSLSLAEKKEKLRDLGFDLTVYDGPGADGSNHHRFLPDAAPEWKDQEHGATGEIKYGQSSIMGSKHIIMTEKGKDDQLYTYGYYIKQKDDFWKDESSRDSALTNLDSSMEEAKKKLKGKDEGINWAKSAPAIFAVGQVLNGFRSALKWLGDFSKNATDTINLPKKAIESIITTKQALNPETWDALFPKRPSSEEIGRTFSVEEIYSNFTKYIKGQKDALWGVAQVLGTFIMKVNTSDPKDADKNRQMTSGCNILLGPPGSGKSMLLLNIRDNLPYNIRSAYLDLSKWDGKEAINTYLSKQKEFEALLSSLNGSYAVLFIEELDKICSTPEKLKKFNEWSHNLYDSGRLGGGEKSNPAVLKGVQLFCTTNAIPEYADIEEGRVVGISLDEGQTGPDVIEDLARKGGRSIPQESHGSTRTRQKLFEFSPPNDNTLPDVIDSNLLGICDSIYASNKLDIQWNRECLKKLASLIHTKKYMSGGNRKIVKDILDKLWDLIIIELNPTEDSVPREALEDGTIRLWLDFEGVDQNGNLILSLANSEEEAKNKAEGLVIEDSGDQVEPLTPEMEKYILGLKLRYLSEALMSLSDAINIDKNRDWGSSLDDAAVKCVSDLASMISRSSSDVNENIKTLVQYRSNLLDTLKVQKINDSLWSSIKSLRSSIKNSLNASMQEVKHSGEEDAAFKLANTLLSNLKSYDNAMKLLGKKLDSFAKNNSVTISRICGLFEDFEDVDDPMDALAFLLNLKNTNEMSRKMTSTQIKAILKLNDQTVKQLKAAKTTLLDNARLVYNTLTDISKLLSENTNNLDISKALSVVDSNLLSKFVKYVDNNVPTNLSDKLNFVTNNLEQIKPKLEAAGASDDTVGLVLGMKSKIDNLIHPKKVVAKEQKINRDLSENFIRLKNISKELIKYKKLLPSLDDMIKADRNLISLFIPNGSNKSNLDRIKYISNDSNDKLMIESLNNAYSKGDITVDQFSDLVEHFAEFNNQILKKVESEEYNEDEDEDEFDESANNDFKNNENVQNIIERLNANNKLASGLENNIGNNSISTDENSIKNSATDIKQNEIVPIKDKSEVVDNKQNEVAPIENKPEVVDNKQNEIVPIKDKSEINEENPEVNKDESSNVLKLIEVLNKKGMTVKELNEKLQDAGLTMDDINKLADDFNKSNIDVNELNIDQIIDELRNQKENKKGNFADELKEKKSELVGKE